MSANKETNGMLDLLIRPGFIVVENLITHANPAAQSLLLLPGTDVRSLLQTGQEEYAAFTDGCLFLTLDLSVTGCGACVVKTEGQDIFLLDQESDDDSLRALALAARELREPLTSMMLCADRLAPTLSGTEGQEHLARLNRGLHQMLRLVGNMSDAGRPLRTSRMELRDVPQFFRELFEKVGSRAAQAGISLTYQGPHQTLLCLADEEQLERAVWNILSNAIKFTPTGGTIQAKLVRLDRTLQLSITDSGSGIAENIRSSLFHRYLRQPGIEDGRYGIGLGMVLIRSAAAAHGGTVLIDRPEGAGTRITLTMAIRQHTDGMLRSPVMRIDYSGEQDHGLIELSDCLPLEAYAK